MARENPGSHQKTLEINLDPSKYGAFAEIGAGQEVVRWFFRVGAAAGTIAKSMSAYDMTVSDAIYGTCDRYVSRQRLQTMLDHEYDLLIERLEPKRGAETEFFVFADTVAARNYKGTNECHGWMGVKFQTAPRGEPNQVLIHMRLLDKDNLSQQEALGILGVNLIYGALNLWQEPAFLMESLLDNLSIERLEIDMIKFEGPGFQSVDHRLMSLKLVQLGLSNAAMFGADGAILQPSEVLYKKPILVERGSFRPVTHVNLDMLECAVQQFKADPQIEGDKVLKLMEITMHNLMSTKTADGEIDYDDFLARADILAATGATVLVSNYFEYYKLAAYLARFTSKKIGIAMGIPSLRDLFDERYYTSLEGGILESFGRLFKNDLKLFIYPLKDTQTGQLITLQKLKVAPHLQNLYEHLIENGFIESIDFYQRDYLHIFSRDVLKKIADGDAEWETMVPPQVAGIIKERKYFGYDGDGS
ncbi:MAG: hypothetical protein JWN98_915 [Abditibacteriota bacterium]|nr:hypothetical protein [Abditibacteriota bacterium]